MPGELRRGARGTAVQALQDLLRARGFDPGPCDGDFGPRTEAAVQAAQAALHPLDGIAREVTLMAIERAPEASRYSYGGEPLRDGVDRDPHKLLPGFAAKVETLFQRMRARGFWPELWEGYRSPERAAELEQAGRGIALSMHCLGAAVDIVDRARLWGAPAEFWDALGEEAERLDLTWGGTWRKRDLPHVQAVRVSEQAQFRAMSPDQRAARVA